jgi:hypothetical protein
MSQETWPCTLRRLATLLESFGPKFSEKASVGNVRGALKTNAQKSRFYHLAATVMSACSWTYGPRLQAPLCMPTSDAQPAQ